MFDKFKKFTKTQQFKKVLPVFIGIIAVFSVIMLAVESRANLEPVESIKITSNNLDYNSNQAGSWQLEKTAKWSGYKKANITFDLDTTASNNKTVDVIYALDTSGEIFGDSLKLNFLESLNNSMEEVLAKGGNVALAQLSISPRIVSGFTNNLSTLNNAAESLQFTTYGRQYDKMFEVINTLLESHSNSSDREVVLVIVTDRYSNQDSSAKAWYQILKDKFSYLTISGVQYNASNQSIAFLNQISDYQFAAIPQNIDSKLNESVSVTNHDYNNFEVIEYIDNEYYTVNDISDIKVSVGEISISTEKNMQKIVWTLPQGMKSGLQASMDISVQVKDKFVDKGGVYPTSKKTEVTSKIKDISEDIKTDKTTILADNYYVTYEANLPSGCSSITVPEKEKKSVYSLVTISEETPVCTGYTFKGWMIDTENVKQPNDSTFTMPEKNVVLKATWASTSIVKSMDGTVYTEKILGNLPKATNSKTRFLNLTTITKEKIESIEFVSTNTVPSDVVASWDASEQQNGSIMGWYYNSTTPGKYNVYIGQKGGVIANEDSSNLFYYLTELDSLNINKLVVKNVKNMANMFNATGFLSTKFILNLGDQFDTSNVTDMQYMFYQTGSYCNLFTLNLGDKFNTAKVTNMQRMFSMAGQNSSYFTLDLGNHFDTSDVTDMQYMFDRTGVKSNIFTLDLGLKFNTSKVTNMREMFKNTGADNTGFKLNLGPNFDTSSVTNMIRLFEGTGRSSTVFTLDLGDKFNTINVTDMMQMFNETGYSSTSFKLELGSKFDTSNVTNMFGMFNNTGYTSPIFTLDLGNNFNTSKVEIMGSMFSGSGYKSLVYKLDLGSKFDTSSVMSLYNRDDMSNMFSETGYTSPVFTLNLGDNFDTSKVRAMNSMFYRTGYSSTNFTLNLGTKFDTSNVEDMSYMFSNTGYKSTVIKLDLGSKFDTSNVTNMDSMFENSGYSSTIFTLNFGNQFVTSTTTSINGMFYGAAHSSSNVIFDLRGFNFNSSGNTIFNTYDAITYTQKAYVKNSSDVNLVKNVYGFSGTIVDCSGTSCP